MTQHDPTSTEAADELCEKIKDIIAPNHHINHQNVRPHAISFTQVGVDYATDAIMHLITDRDNRLKEAMKKAKSKSEAHDYKMFNEGIELCIKLLRHDRGQL